MADASSRKPHRKVRSSKPASAFDVAPVVTQHEMTIAGEALMYSAHAGVLTIYAAPAPDPDSV